MDVPFDPERLRTDQATVLWKRGWGHLADRRGIYHAFPDYLATIRPIPTVPDDVAARFPYPILVDERVHAADACTLLGIEHPFGNSPPEAWTVDLPSAHRPVGLVYWIRCADPDQRLGLSLPETQARFQADETSLTLQQGLHWYAQHGFPFLHKRILACGGSANPGDQRRHPALLVNQDHRVRLFFTGQLSARSKAWASRHV